MKIKRVGKITFREKFETPRRAKTQIRAFNDGKISIYTKGNDGDTTLMVLTKTQVKRLVKFLSETRP